jgi:hypothetical protein
MRLAISRAIIVESARGWGLDKLKQARKIDVAVALSLAAWAGIKGLGESSYVSDMSWVSSDSDDGAAADAAEREFQAQRFQQHLRYHSGYYNSWRRW